MKQITILLLLLACLKLNAQKISNEHLYVIKSIEYDGGSFFAYDIDIVPLVEDSIVITKFWIGNRRYYDSRFIDSLGYYDRPAKIVLCKKISKESEFTNRILIYFSGDSYGCRSNINEEKIQKKYIPPFKYKGIAMIEYFIKNKRYYYVIPKVNKKRWMDKFRGNYNVQPELCPERPPHQYQRKQQ